MNDTEDAYLRYVTEGYEPVELLDEVSTATIRPGDTAVFSTTAPVTVGQLETIRDALAAKLPGVTVVVVDRVRFEVTYRPSNADEVNEEAAP